MATPLLLITLLASLLLMASLLCCCRPLFCFLLMLCSCCLCCCWTWFYQRSCIEFLLFHVSLIMLASLLLLSSPSDSGIPAAVGVFMMFMLSLMLLSSLHAIAGFPRFCKRLRSFWRPYCWIHLFCCRYCCWRPCCYLLSFCYYCNVPSVNCRRLLCLIFSLLLSAVVGLQLLAFNFNLANI